jgi:hypothetical protein
MDARPGPTLAAASDELTVLVWPAMPSLCPARPGRPSEPFMGGPGVSPEATRTPQTGWPDLHQALSGTPAHGLGMVGRVDGSGFRVTVPVLG